MENAGKNAHPITTLQTRGGGDGGAGRLREQRHDIKAGLPEPRRPTSSARRKWGAASLRAASGLPQALLLLIIMIMITFQEH